MQIASITKRQKHRKHTRNTKSKSKWNLKSKSNLLSFMMQDVKDAEIKSQDKKQTQIC